MKVTHHPNGFLKVVLKEEPDGSQLRLHAWDVPGEDSDIHQHRADFTSRVVEGFMLEEIYGYEDCEDGNCERLTADCRTDSAGRYHVDVKITVPCRVRVIRTERHGAGETYFRDARDLHKAIAVKVPLITIVSFGPVYQQVHDIIRERKQ